jgi:hypothetical protein
VIYRLVLSSTDLCGLQPYHSQKFNLGDQLTGMLDEAVIFPRAISGEVVAAWYHSEYHPAALEYSGNQVYWQAQVPNGLEGPYNLNVRAVDGEGHVLTDLTNVQQWGGVVDRFPPRLTVKRSVDADDANLLHYEFEVIDTMLDPDTIRQNLCQGIQLEKEYYNSSWFLAGGIAPNTALYRVSGSCTTDARTTEETGIVACDSAGNCAAQTYDAQLPEKLYLPLVVGGSSGGTPLLPGEHPRLAEVLARAVDWPRLADSLQSQPDGAAPQAWINNSQIGYQDVRSVLHINLHGGLVNGESVRDLDLIIRNQNGMEVATQAAVFGDVWNAFWPFTPGDPPADGLYQIELILTDQNGQQTTQVETITVLLKP